MKKIIILALALIASFSIFGTGSARAAEAWRFDPGRIIDDYVFYNSNSMNTDQIRYFIESKMPNCDTHGTQPASDYGRSDLTHAQYASLRGWQSPPYTCLRNYAQNTPQMEASSGYCAQLSGGWRTSAQIINDVSKSCGINPQVLLVLLQKEQSLLTDNWPTNNQYNKATGFSCPDTAPCDPNFAGFFYQVYYAARQFKVYQARPASYNYEAGRDNSILWHPNAGCGRSNVWIQNQATAALYIYTPYRPNQAALDNLYGTGDGCSSYGNRNFWRLFTDWFGSTYDSYVSFETPRWMTLNKDQKKSIPGTNAYSPNSVDLVMPTGMQIKFVSKIWADGQWYFRTEYDTSLGLNKGIPASAVNEIPYVNLETPRWMTLTANTQKYISAAERATGSTFFAGRNIHFADKVQVNGKWYFRTQTDKDSGNPYGIPSNLVSEASLQNFDTPRWMVVNKLANKTDPIFMRPDSSSVPANTQLKFNKKIILNDKTYFQLESDNGTNLAIDSADISDISYSTLPSGDTWMALNKQSHKFHPSSGTIDDNYTFAAGTHVRIGQRITVNGQQFLRTAFDAEDNTDLAFAIDDLDEIDFIPLDAPRIMKLNVSTKKTYPKTGQQYNFVHEKGTEIMFTTKIFVNGVWYLRSEYDTAENVELGIPQSLLAEL